MAAQEKKADKNARPRGMRGGEGGGMGRAGGGAWGVGGLYLGFSRLPHALISWKGMKTSFLFPLNSYKLCRFNLNIE